MSLRRKSTRSFNASMTMDNTAMLLASPTTYRRQRQLDASVSMDTTAASSTYESPSFLPGEISKFYNQSMLAEATEPLDTLAQSFFDIINSFAERGSPFDAIKEYHQLCKNVHETSKDNKILAWWLEGEKNTWRLVETLYKDRLNDTDEHDAPMELTHSEKEAMLDVFKRDSVTRQCQLVVDWLEQAESDRKEHSQTLRAEHFSEKTICWENTVYQLKNGQRMAGQPGSMYSLNLITEIDADAPVRQNKQIHKLDLEDDARLLGQILSLVRCGQLEKAQQLCMHCGQPWRAATLEGWRLYHNPNLNVEGELRVLLPTEGNPNRDLWKLAAWRMSEDIRVPQLTRTTYAVLCGHLQSMLPSMLTWSDWLWAHLKAMIDVRIEEEIRERVDRQYIDMPESYWSNKLSLMQIFAALASCPDMSVRTEHAEEFPTVQRALILDDMVTLYSTLVSWTRQHKELPTHKSPLLLRFAAHLVLTLRQLGKEETESCAQCAAEVLRTYSHYAMTLQKPELTISYISQLPKRDQVETLAVYLESITDPELKSHCLVLANNLGLDVESTAQKVVVSIREKPVSLNGNPISEDEAKVQALDWLVICPSQGGEALWHANALVRKFVSQGKLELARAAYNKIPPESMQELCKKLENAEDEEEPSIPSRHKAALKEHFSFKIYLDAHKDFGEWLHYLHKRKPVEPEPVPRESTFQQKMMFEENLKKFRNSFETWQKTLATMSEMCKKRFINILTFPEGGWLQDNVEIEPSQEVAARRAEMDSLVKMVIPQSAFLVHEICLKSGQPQGSLELSNIIASDTYCLYKQFSKKDLRELLQKLTESSVELLKMKMDPFGFEPDD